MPFGEIFTGAFTRIWRHKTLWLLAMIGLALTGVSTLVSALLTSRWLSGYFTIMNRMLRNPGAMPGRALGDFMNSMGWIWAAGALLMLLGLLGYIVNLVARAGIINEASHAWSNQTTDTGRGLRAGAQRAVYVFLLDLLWLLPGLVLAIGGFIAFFVLTFGTISVADERGGAGGLIASSWIAFACCGGCLALLYYLVFSVFSPLMYQSAVAGRRDFGTAVREGWALARANLGPMIIFWVLLLLVGFVLGIVQQTINTVFSLPLMSGWFSAMSSMMQGSGNPFRSLPAVSGPLLVLAGLVSAVLWFLINTFTQTLNLTVYGGVYQHLAGVGPAGPVEAPPPPLAPEPPATATPEPAGLVVPPAPRTEDEPPPAL